MTAAAGPAPATQRNTSTGPREGRNGETERDIRTLHAALSDSGLSMSPARVAKLVRKRHRDMRSVEPRRVIELDADLAGALAYADPRGNRAQGRVDRAEGWVW